MEVGERFMSNYQAPYVKQLKGKPSDVYLRTSIVYLGSSMQDCHLQEGNRDSGEDRLEKLSTELIHLSSGDTFSLRKELRASAEIRLKI